MEALESTKSTTMSFDIAKAPQSKVYHCPLQPWFQHPMKVPIPSSKRVKYIVQATEQYDLLCVAEA